MNTATPVSEAGPILGLATPHHPLRCSWTFWCSTRSTKSSHEAYLDNVKQVGTVSSVEEFWSYYSHMAPISDLPLPSDYHLFKDGIKPMWEDEVNKDGGKWIVRLRKGVVVRFWENLVFALIGEQFDVDDEICGAVVSSRFHEDILSVWNRTSSKSEVTMKIKDTLKLVLQLPSTVVMEYKAHNASLRDKSSYKNTDVFR